MKRKPTQRKKPRRVVLGVGYPWYTASTSRGAGIYNAVALFETEKSAAEPVELKYYGTGNWNRVRLILEILK